MHKIKILLLSIMCLMMSLNTIYAFDYNQKGTITITDTEEVSHIELYQIAYFNNEGTIKINKPFQDYNINYNLEYASDLKNLALTLKGVIYQEDVKCLKEMNVLHHQDAFFGGLKTGLYLVIVSPVKEEDSIKKYSPILVTIPEINQEEDNYDVIVDLKYQEEEIDETSLDIKKIWKNTDQPQDIVVNVFKDKELYKEVILSKENNYAYHEDHLSTQYDYTVMEKTKLDDYQVTISKDGYTYYIVNTYINKEEEPSIPQTGQLWWPVPVLLVSGLSLYMLGTYMTKEENNNG